MFLFINIAEHGVHIEPMIYQGHLNECCVHPLNSKLTNWKFPKLSKCAAGIIAVHWCIFTSDLQHVMLCAVNAP